MTHPVMQRSIIQLSNHEKSINVLKVNFNLLCRPLIEYTVFHGGKHDTVPYAS